MDILKVCLSSIGSIIVLFISTKLIGNKQMSELNMFDYINGITIGSIAAEMATSLEGDFYYPIVAMAVYTGAMLLISYLTGKKVAIRRFLTGKSIILMSDGKVYRENFNTAKIDINEFLTQCRVNGFFNLDDIDTAILEQNGKLSFLPKVAARPVNTKDLNLALKQEKLSLDVILDGNVMEDNLRQTGNDVEWLKRELKKQKIESISDVFIGICNTGNNTLSVYRRTGASSTEDVFQ